MSVRVLLDTNFLSAYTYDSTSANFKPEDATDFLEDRLNFLVEQLSQKDAEIIIPAPVLAETLSARGADITKIIPILESQAAFRIVDFGQRAAVEFAMLYKEQKAYKNDGQTKAPFKFDLSIIAIAKISNVSTIYSADKDLIKRAQDLDFKVCDFQGLARRPSEDQGVLIFPAHKSLQ
ncbi:MAG: PIN domain-containing protein [Komagataeibacter saccharivorans]|uniref:PIN domain-containing protein n=1 Tax=Komagataeibacter saccharivorans TaxID=265959 RepID=UPI0039EC93B7